MPVGYLTKYQKWINDAERTKEEIQRLKKELSDLGTSKNDLSIKNDINRQIVAKQKWYEICKARAIKVKL